MIERLDTQLTRMFGCKYPIIQGALAYWSRAELAAAVSNAGGLGIITSYQFTTREALRNEIRKTRDLTDNAFGVNINLFPAKRPVQNEEVVNVVVEEGVRFVETSGQSPEHFLIKLHAAGVKVIHKVAGLRYAQHAEKIGVDAVTIVGFEAGGHPGMGEVTTLVLIPAVVERLKIPVIAAGGFANGKGLLSALSLGASGVVFGTAFLLAKECPIHNKIKEKLLQATINDTMIIDRSIKSARRVLRNPAAERVLGMEQLDTKLDDLLKVMGGVSSKLFLDEGDLTHGVLSCGQAIGLMGQLPSAKEFIEGIICEAEERLKYLNDMIFLHS